MCKFVSIVVKTVTALKCNFFKMKKLNENVINIVNGIKGSLHCVITKIEYIIFAYQKTLKQTFKPVFEYKKSPFEFVF